MATITVGTYLPNEILCLRTNRTSVFNKHRCAFVEQVRNHTSLPAYLLTASTSSLRLSRIQLHDTIINQLNIILTDSTKGDEQASIAHQQSKSRAIIKDLAGEICASIPQLADYIEQLPSYIERELNDTSDRFEALEYKPGQPMLSLNLTTATVELSTHFIYDPGPFKKTPPRFKLRGVPQPRPGSLYHAYYQLYHLELIPGLPADMKKWIRGRLGWIEEMGDPEDLELMKALLRRPLARLKVPRSPPTSLN
jgi:hypothetical protein